jgi:adenine-specific DNA-methyltransferase
MARLEDKIAEIKDPELRRTIVEEVKALKQQKQFGLVYETHQPEVVPLFSAKVTARETVAKRAGKLSETYRVERVHHGKAELIKDNDDSRESALVDSLVVVRRMGQTIYPALMPMDQVQSGNPGDPCHILIEADNYHALQLLGYLYAGKVDCIYIDPPYNSGARDWKYNNDYVDKNDQWRHSKWLTFMEKRLQLAKRLLNPKTGVLIVTIDENEIYHLGMLLENIFPDSVRQMVTIVINPKGTGKVNFARVEEQALYCIPNVEGGVIKGVSTSNEDDDDVEVEDNDMSHLDPSKSHLWELRHARRRGSESSYRHQRWNQFYPLYIDEESKTVVRSGPSIPLGEEPTFQKTADGLTPIWPIDHDRNHRCWRFVSTKMQYLIEHKRVVLGKFNRKKGTWTINIWERKPSTRKLKTVWWDTSHDAGTHGTTLLHNILGVRGAFAFPKSIYAVRDTISAVVADRPDALIIDFFAGSGTTLNAINLQNNTDSGRRQCILVTNNEVSEKEAQSMSERGLSPGAEEWEHHGICRSVTWPRSKFTINGKRDDGTPLDGEYLTGRTVTREKPRTIRQLGFAEGQRLPLAQRKQLVALIPGVPQSKITADMAWFLDDEINVSILFDATQTENWLEALEDSDHVTDFYVLSPDTRLFNQIKLKIQETLGPLTIEEEEKRPLANGSGNGQAIFCHSADAVDDGGRERPAA